MRNRSLYRSFIAGAGIIIAGALALGGGLLWRDYNEWRRHESMLPNLELFCATLDATNTLAAEHSPAFRALSSPLPADLPTEQALAKSHAASVKALDDIQHFLTTQRLAHLANPSLSLMETRRRLTLTQDMIDRLARLPGAQRPPDEIKAALDAPDETAKLLKPVVLTSYGHAITENPMAAGPASLALMISRLLLLTQSMAANWDAALIQKRPLSPAEDNQIRQDYSQIEFLLPQINFQSDLYLESLPHPTDGQAYHFEAGLPWVRLLLEESRKGTGYSLRPEQFAELMQKTCDAQLKVRDLIIVRGIERAKEDAHMAKQNMVFSIILTTCIILLLCAILLAARRDLFLPLLHARSEIIRLAEGDTNKTSVTVTGGKEMRSLFAALDILRQRAIELREAHLRLRQIGDNLPNSAIYELQEMADGSFRYLYVSNSIKRLLGLSVEEVILDSDSLHRLQFLEDQVRQLAAGKKVRANSSPFDFTRRHRRPDGRIVWVQSRAAPHPGPNGSVLWDGVMTDVSAHRQVEEQSRLLEQANRELVASRAFQEATGHMARLGGWEFDPGTLRGRWSDEIMHILEVPSGELDDFRLSARYFSPGSYTLYRDAFDRCLANGTAWDLDLEMITGTGRRIWARMFGAAEIHDGKPEMLRGAFQETTERKEMEQKLREEHNLLRTLIDHLPMIAFITDRDGRLLVYNRVLLDAWKIPAGTDLTGRFVHAYMPGENAGRLLAESDTVMASGQPLLHHIEFDDQAEGEGVWHRTSKIPWRDSQGRIIGLVCLSADITEEQLAQQKIKEQSAMLLQANAALQVAVTRAEQLARSAQASEQAKSEFIAVMSHEIRTPLNAVLGMATLLQTSGSFNTEQREYLDTIKASSTAMTDLIANILDHSKLEANAMALEETSCDLVELAASCLGIITEHAGAKGLLTGLNVTGPFPLRVMADGARIRQILLNLLSNAVKFTEQGEISIILAAGVLEGGKQRVTIQVCDTGIGMTSEQQTKLFQPFAQADASITRRYGGTGLGLSISRRLAHLMNGELTLQSGMGIGSDFTLTLPLTVAEKNQPPSGPHILVFSRRPAISTTLVSVLRHLGAEAAVETEGRAGAFAACAIIDHDLGEAATEIRQKFPALPCYLLTPRERSASLARETGFAGVISYPPGVAALRTLLGGSVLNKDRRDFNFDPTLGSRHPLHLLIADDNSVNQRVLQLMLKRMGYQADAVVNGREAVDAWKQNDYDLILMDCHMPGVDGFSATQEIRRIEQAENRRHTYIVALTADAREEVWQVCASSGMDGYLAKPINPEALGQTLLDLNQGAMPKV